MNTLVIGGSLAALMAGVLVSCPAQAQITKSGSGYLLRAKYSKGERLAYALQTATAVPTMTQTAQAPQKVQIGTQMVLEVLNVQGTVATLNVRLAPFTMNGKPVGGGNGQNFQVKLDNTNKPIGGGPPNLSSMSTIGGTIFPDKPLKIGDSFTRNVQTSGIGGMPISLKTVFTFAGLKNLGGKQVAQLNLVMNGSGTPAMTGTGVTYLSVADGSLVRSTSNIDAHISGPQSPKPLSLKVTAVVQRQ